MLIVVSVSKHCPFAAAGLCLHGNALLSQRQQYALHGDYTSPYELHDVEELESLCTALVRSPDDVQEHSIFAGHGGAVVGLHQQWPCFGALLKVAGGPLRAGQGLVLGHQASLWQAAHALPPPKVLFCQLLDLHHTSDRLMSACHVGIASQQCNLLMPRVL